MLITIINKSKLWINTTLILCFIGGINFSVFADVENNHLKKVSLDQPNIKNHQQRIRPQLLSLIKSSHKYTQSIDLNKKIKLNINTFTNIKPHLNVAEQFLFAIVKARLAHFQNKPQQVIKLLTAAEPLEKRIAKAQLDQPLFFAFDLLMSKSYEKLKKFDKAYKYKRNYLHKYGRNNEAQKKHLVKLLTNKYQTQKMAQENKLLAGQNALEKIKIQQVTQLKNNQKRNNFILIIIGISFVVIMFRQYKIRQQLIKLSRTDVLTGLVNRKTLFYLGEQLHAKAQAQQFGYSVIYFDCDKFKKINDEYGHQVGDKVLQTIAKIGQEVIRTRDVFARLGGEEFALILPDESLSKAKAVAEHLRAKIAAHHFSSLGIEHTITASFGVASLNDNINYFDQLINLADAAMYQAKELGRNRVVCHDNSLNISDDLMPHNSADSQHKVTIRST